MRPTTTMPAFQGRPGRRDFVRVGFLGSLGLATSLRSSAAITGTRAKAKSCILIWLDGGPSHLETFDLKPDVPADVRGPFRPIATTVAGLEMCEHLPNLARQARHLAVVRSMTSPLGEHGIANHYLLTGYKPSPVLDYPSYGAVVSHAKPQTGVLPSYIAVPDYRSTAGSGLLGSAHRPFATGGDPAKPDFQVRDLDLFPRVTAGRMERRREFLELFESAQSTVEKAAPRDAVFEQAFRMTVSPQAKAAFDLSRETPKTRERYGPRTIGQSCLLARRLVEAGVPFVTVLNTGWDTHDGLTLQLRDGYSGAKQGVGLIPSLDLALSGLLADLSERGLLESTLVVAMGEFGRTPKLNTRAGRDHWPRVFSVVLAGGGIPGGQVFGSSDRVGESPKDNPVTPSDLAATLYTLLGINPQSELRTPDGRPVQVNQGGQVIRALLG